MFWCFLTPLRTTGENFEVLERFLSILQWKSSIWNTKILKIFCWRRMFVASWLESLRVFSQAKFHAYTLWLYVKILPSVILSQNKKVSLVGYFFVTFFVGSGGPPSGLCNVADFSHLFLSCEDLLNFGWNYKNNLCMQNFKTLRIVKNGHELDTAEV